MKIPYWYLLLGPAALSYLGSGLNVIVVGLNHGQMPVMTPGPCTADILTDSYHSCMIAATHLKLFSDWIGLDHGIASIGDMFIFLSESINATCLTLWAVLMIKDHNERSRY